MAKCFRQVDEGWVLAVRLTPNAGKDVVEGIEQRDNGSRLKVRVSAVPEKGKANKALCKILAKTFGLPKSSLEVISGPKSRTKTVLIRASDFYPDTHLENLKVKE